MHGDVIAIIPAAGASLRLGGKLRKPFVALNGRPLLAHTLRALQETTVIHWILPVVRRGEEAEVVALAKRYRITKILPPCQGGGSRAESVARGFAAIPNEAQWVLIHDGARPCVSRSLIQHAVRAGKRYGAVACGLPASLTVKVVDEHADVRVTLDRDHLWFVQTPQVFRRDWLTQALAKTNHHLARFPDDAAIVESAGFRVRMIPGDPLNLKVTTNDDLLLAEAILKSKNGRSEVRQHKKRTAV